MTGRGLLVAAGLTLVVVACSGDDDASPTTSQALPPTESTSTTEATTPANVPDTTPPTPETPPPTLPAEPTTTAATAPPETTAPPSSEQIRQDVIDAAFAAWKSLNDLRLDPMNDDLLEALATTRTGASLDSAIEIVASYRARGQRSITHPEFPAFFEAYPATVDFDLESGLASVEYCRLGSNIFVQTGAAADGGDLVLDDTINAYRERSDLTLTESGWLESGGVVLKASADSVTCAE